MSFSCAGEEKMTVYNHEGDYKGDLGADNKPHGFGTLDIKVAVYEGTFEKGKINGYCKYSVNHLCIWVGRALYTKCKNLSAGEMKDSMWDGDVTSTYKEGDKDIHCNEFYDPSNSWMTRDEVPEKHHFDVYDRTF